MGWTDDCSHLAGKHLNNTLKDLRGSLPECMAVLSLMPETLFSFYVDDLLLACVVTLGFGASPSAGKEPRQATGTACVGG